MSSSRLGWPPHFLGYATGLVLLTATVGCTVGPKYQAPARPAPSHWSELQEGKGTAQSPEIATWWTAFNDPLLNSLIERASRENLDLRQATARVREARARYGMTAADRFPAVDASGSFTRSRSSENGPLAFTPTAGREVNLYQIGFDASWEVDLFGGVRRSIEAAEADIAASVEDRRSVQVSLLAEVARNYIDLRRIQKQIATTRNNISSQQETLELTQARFNAGLNTGLDVARSEAQVATSFSQIPALEISLKQTIHRLGVLLGEEPGRLSEQLSKPQPIPAPPAEVIVGLPSELLRRRPDIRRAERQLAAATARIGVATADLFPRFSLTGAFGLQSATLSDLPEGGSRFFSIGPAVRWPIFSGGRIRANIAVQNAREEEALIEYEKTLLLSFEEVENALIAYAREQTRRQSLREAVAANRRAVDIGNELFIRGLANFLDVLESERSLFASESQLDQSEAAVSANLVALYKALGGGWEIASADGPARPQ
jgi:NodT family efflux transporter outer membrane factor (OMF) lipoprotein